MLCAHLTLAPTLQEQRTLIKSLVVADVLVDLVVDSVRSSGPLTQPVRPRAQRSRARMQCALQHRVALTHYHSHLSFIVISLCCLHSTNFMLCRFLTQLKRKVAADAC